MTLPDDYQAAAIIPDSTYRLQFNKHFTFNQAADCVTYLHQLDISHCYASPFLKARPGSTHGYDIVDHNALNSEIGSQHDFDHFISSLQRLFDVDWHPLKKALDNKILIPVLGDEGTETDLRCRGGEFSICYFKHRFPIDPQTYPFILSCRHPQLAAHFKPDDPVLLEYQTLANSFGKMPRRTERSALAIGERARDKEVFKKQLARLCSDHSEVLGFLELRLAEINRETSGPLHTLLEQQVYRLAYWRVAGDEINYRRFFDINDLAGLRVEEETVFEASHRFILTLIEQGNIQGLRIDHADGLYDPAAYYQRLNGEKALESSAEAKSKAVPIYIVAEKIVANYECLSSEWPIDGTTGYEFAAIVNGVFIDVNAEKPLTRTYQRFVGQRQDFDEIVYQAKKYVMTASLASELNMLANQLSRIAKASSKTRDYTLNALHDALLETVACFPVYRTYINGLEVRKEDSQYIEWAIQQGEQRSCAADKTVFDFLGRVLQLKAITAEVGADALLKFVMKFQQYTAPVMAKGFEDTALYEYCRLISLNEVGGDPWRFGSSVNTFHHFNLERVKKWPHSLLCLSSHDNKRSADARARINVLTEIPKSWQEAVSRWRRMNRIPKKNSEQADIARNDEYLFYQTLIGTWPLTTDSDSAMASYRKRIENDMIKAVREAKQHSSWSNPNEAYERAVRQFVDRCLDGHGRSAFLEDFIEFEKRIWSAGLYNAVAQTLIQLTSPGVPDIYQGSELWQFSLVDPDNRRPVDFDASRRLLAELNRKKNDRAELLSALLETMEDGRIKLFVVTQTLGFRRRHAALFRGGEYLKINTRGKHAEHLLAFARKNRNQFVVIAAPPLTMSLLTGSHRFKEDVWQDTWLELPLNAPARYRELFSQRWVQSGKVEALTLLPVADAFRFLPFAILSAPFRV